MNLHEKILTIYPELIGYDFAFGSIRLQNDGDGDYIHTWNHPTLSQPTQQELDAVTGDYVVNHSNISARQLYLQLNTINKWDSLQAILTAPGNEFLQGLFDRSHDFYIEDQYVIDMAALLNEDLQTFFNAAKQL